MISFTLFPIFALLTVGYIKAKVVYDSVSPQPEQIHLSRTGKTCVHISYLIICIVILLVVFFSISLD